MKIPSREILQKDEAEAWTRFERAVDAAIKGGPKHRPAKERPVSKGRVHKGKSRT